MQTALVTVEGQKRSVTARLLLDIGASRSFCKTSVCQQIGAKFVGSETVSISNFEATKRKDVQYLSFEISLIDNSGSPIHLTVSATKTISCPVERQALNKEAFPLLNQIKLADTLIDAPELSEIDILIGSDYYYEIVGSEQIRCSGGLILLGTKFGYVVAGKVPADTESVTRNDSMMLIQAPTIVPDNNATLERFWRLEEIGITDKPADPADEDALEYFNRTVRFNEDEGRYEVRWPWKVEDPDLPDNYDLSLRRLKGLHRRTSSSVLRQYGEVIDDQRKKGVIEEAPAVPDGTITHHLPHHLIISAEKTTKLRVVYDASSKTDKSLLSLNECLNRGPVFLSDLCGLLMRFRLNKIAITSDIEKAFLQISLMVADRDVTRFLWLRDLSKPPSKGNLVCYRFRRVPFGVISSPFLLAAVIRHHLSLRSTEISKHILRSLYADNVILGLNSLDAALHYYKHAKHVFSEAHMNLREWHSNDSQFMEAVKPEDRGKRTSTKVLGLQWDLKTDTLSCSDVPNHESKVTKRSVLQSIARVFDPCGFFSPVTIKGRMIMQQLWRANCEWNSILPEEIAKGWTIHSEGLRALSAIKIPRQVTAMSSHEGTTFELHAFCDSSKTAYGAAIYLLSSCEGVHSSALVFAKARVCPLKERSIPQLELVAATIAARLAKFTRQEIDITMERTFIWSDSQCVLHWILGRQVATTFVRNRVNEIRSHKDLQFRYCPTGDYPADLITRGISVYDLESSTLWWNGPHWLTKGEVSWPFQKDFTSASNSRSGQALKAEQFQGITTTLAVTAQTDSRNSQQPLLQVARFSSWQKLTRTVAWAVRFCHNCKNVQKRSGFLKAFEISQGLTAILRDVQRQNFPKTLLSERHRPSWVQQLGLFESENGLLRCSGRLDNSDLPYDERYPIILPKTDPITDFIITSLHERLAHAGLQHVLTELRKNYWVAQGRSRVKRILRGCRVCRRLSGGPYVTPSPPPLPDIRSRQSKSFSNVGLDYLGPLFICGPPKQKVWICIFSCCSTRAMHLDIVLDLSAEQFLLCLRRFMALYGKPDRIISDNASQFHCAERVLSNVLKEMLTDEDVVSFCASQGIQWSFIVELAPWMGGFYEGMISLVKRSLKSIMGRALLPLIQLQTVVQEVGSILNSRPLAYVEDQVGSKIITPNDLVTHGRPNFPAVNSEQDVYVEKPTQITALVQRWRAVEQSLSMFWNSWRTDYLNSVRQQVWQPRQRTEVQLIPSVNDVVILKDSLPRNLWKIGRIVELYESADRVCRSAKIRLPNGRHLKRPIRLLYPLETSDVSSAREPQTDS